MRAESEDFAGTRLLSALLLISVMAPISANEWGIDVGHARLKTDAFVMGDTNVRAFSEDVPSLTGGLQTSARGVPLTIAASITTEGRSHRLHPMEVSEPGPPGDMLVRQGVQAYGARVGFNPSWEVGDGWEADVALGVQYLRVMIDNRQPDGVFQSKETQSQAGIWGGAGISRRLQSGVAIRGGIELGPRYQAVNLGVRVGF